MRRISNPTLISFQELWNGGVISGTYSMRSLKILITMGINFKGTMAGL